MKAAGHLDVGGVIVDQFVGDRDDVLLTLLPFQSRKILHTSQPRSQLPERV